VQLASSPRSRRRLLAAPLGLYLATFLAYPTLYAVKLAVTDGTSGVFPSLESVRVRMPCSDAGTVAGNLLVPLASVTLELLAGLALALLLPRACRAAGSCARWWVIPFALPEIVFLTIVRAIPGATWLRERCARRCRLAHGRLPAAGRPLAYSSA
jgi:ABC-type sugar transport system permease subunit